MVAKRKPVRGYAAGGQVSGLVPRSGKTDAWIDNIPVDRYDTANSADRKLSRKPPNVDTDDDINTGPQPPRESVEHSRGGKVRKVLKRARR